MDIFLSWSGERSKAVASLLDTWLQCVIQALKPWMSDKDINKGSQWSQEINNQLKITSRGIICLTQENKNKPWILFEAGALAKGLSESKVCTFLVDLESSDISGPLSQFNHTFPTKTSLWGLVLTLNGDLEDKALNDAVLKAGFNTYWPRFEESFQKILDNTPILDQGEARATDDFLKEILELTREIDRSIKNSGNESSIFPKSISIDQLLRKRREEERIRNKSSLEDLLKID